MRYGFLLSGCLLWMCIMSCSKSVDSLSDPGCCCASVPGDLSGSWELRSLYGGFRSGIAGEVEPGNGNIYTFKGNSYWRYENHALRDSGTYSLTKSRGPENGDPADAIAFSAGDTLGYVFSNDTLVMNPRAPMYDGVASRYIRISSKY